MDTCEPELSPRERAQVAATWLERARAEELAVIRFERLSGELRACGTHPTVLAMVDKAIVHEGEHAQLCLGLARGYGARHVHTSESEQAGPLAPASMGRSDALLFEMVAYCCLTESLNAALLLEIAQRASQREIVRAAQKILKDEVQHSQMGWAHLTWCRAQGLGDFLPEVLPTMFNQTGAEAFASSQSPLLESPALLAHGELPLDDRKTLFDRVVREVFLPGLAHAGLKPEPGYAWIDTHFAL